MTRQDLIDKYWSEYPPGYVEKYNRLALFRGWRNDQDSKKIKKKDLMILLFSCGK